MPRSTAPCWLAFLAAVGVALTISAARAETGGVGVLRLHGGHHLAGRWQAGDQADALLWSTDLSEGAYEFPWEEVSQVVLPDLGKPAPASGRYRFEMVDGNNLRGDLVRVDPEWLTVETRFDPRSDPLSLRLRRASLRRIVSLGSEGGMIYQGPDAPEHWTTAAPEHWRFSGNSLSTQRPRASIFRNLDLPNRFLVELDVSWGKKSDFEIQFAVPEKAKPLDDAAEQRRRQRFGMPPKSGPVGGYALRTVGGWLVAMRELGKAANLQPLIEVANKEGRFVCRLYGDQRAGRLLVTTSHGEKLADFTVPAKNAVLAGGVRITNRQGGLRVKGLRAYEWDGSSPVAADSDRLGAISSSGEFTPGVLVGYDREAQTFSFSEPPIPSNVEAPSSKASDTPINEGSEADPPEDPEAQVDETAEDEPSEPEGAREAAEQADPEPSDSAGDDPESPPTEEAALETLRAESIAAILLSPGAAADAPAAEGVALVLRDGSRLSGKPREVVENTLYLESGATAQAIPIPLTAVREARGLGQPETQEPRTNAAAEPWVFETASSRMVGRLGRGVREDGVSQLLWRPAGSRKGLPLRHDVKGRLFLPSVEQKPAAPSPEQATGRRERGGWFGVVAKVLGGDASSWKADPARAPAARAPSYPSVIYLRGGDKLPCRVRSITPEGVAIESRYVNTDLIAHEHLKAIELKTRGVDGTMVDSRRERLLTLPRMQRDNPPTHLLVSSRGDYLRCRLMKLDDRQATIEVHLEEQQIERSRIARVIWLDQPGEEESADGADSVDPGHSDRLRVQALRRDGIRMTFQLEAVEELPDQPDSLRLVGTSPAIGDCQIDLAGVEVLQLGTPDSPPSPKRTYQLWKMRAAKTPREDPSSAASPEESSWVGEPAPDFEAPWFGEPGVAGLEGERFKLSELRGKVVVLDFWASWCGPCIRSMPGTKRLVDEYADRGAVMIGVNLQETPEEVAATLERMKLELPVVLDRDGVAAQRYQVNGIPHTVLIDRDGRVARLLIGGGPDAEELLRDAIERAVAPNSDER